MYIFKDVFLFIYIYINIFFGGNFFFLAGKHTGLKIPHLMFSLIITTERGGILNKTVKQ